MRMALDIYPAIDLKDGKAVRLFKGEMQSAKVYGEALDFAKSFEDMGAKFLHIVDLDGAMAGIPKNLTHIEKIITSTALQVQVGGGIRDENRIKLYTQMGARVILESYPVAVGIDSRNGKVATQGWVEESTLDSQTLATKFAGSKVQAIICTDINRDGALSGINIDWTESIAKSSGIYTIASGGFARLDELHTLDKSPYISGVIVGKAFYEGKINLKEALQFFRD